MAISSPGETAPVPVQRTDFREPGSAPRWRVGVGAVVVAILVLVGIGVIFSAVSAAGEGSSRVMGAPTETSVAGNRSRGAAPVGSTGAGSTATLFVHVLGSVAKPGLYELDSGARAIDAVAAAGGFRPNADQASINLARLVSDGEQIVIPAVGESPEAVHPAPGAPASGPGATAGVVDLNSADATALETLPGVGPATATAILAWRDEHGRFESVDDLLDVTGIGEKKLESMRDSVAVR